jgi:hypothetical protein
MFCPNCGQEGSGNFCSRCGHPLEQPSPAAAAPSDWHDEVDYQKLLSNPEVRTRISLAQGSDSRMSADDFLKLAESLVKPLIGEMPVPLPTVAALAQSLGGALGIRTGKHRAEVLSEPPGLVIVAALCYLAGHGQAIERVDQGKDGCILHAVLPSDLFSSQGRLAVSIARCEHGTQAEAVTRISGQLFDWGKSQRWLDGLFAEMQAHAAS